MVGNNGDAIDQLDQFWDETIRGIGGRSSDLDRGLAKTVRRLYGMNEAVVPDGAFARRLWTDLSQPVPAVLTGAAPHAPTTVIPIAERNLPLMNGVSYQRQILRQAQDDGVGVWRDERGLRLSRINWRGGVAQLLTVMIIVLTLASGYVAVQLQPLTSKERLAAVRDAPSHALYAFAFEGTGEDRETDRWVATSVDPTTLADLRPSDADMPAWAGTLAEKWSGHWWTLSADRSTFAVIETRQYVNGVAADEITIGIYDATTGAVRSRIQLPVKVQSIRVSPDGARAVLLVTDAPGSGPSVSSPGWYVIDTADGEVVATVEPDEEDGWHADSWIDPTASRLYRLFIPLPGPMDNGPGPARLVANDLTTGSEIGQLELPQVWSGVWRTSRTYEASPGVEYLIFGELRPGAALSPDGKTLAIVHADEEAVTIVDTERLVVERTEALTRPTGWGSRLLGLVLPDDAAAKAPGEGTDLRAVFAADGRHLYVFGFETSVDEDGADSRSLGLRLIDLETAEIVADTDELADGFFTDVIPSPNGQDLYVSGSQPPDVMWSEDVPTRLWRLDAATLEVLATRDFKETPRIILSPAVPDGRGQMPPGVG